MRRNWNKQLWKMRRHLRISNIVKEAITQNKLFILRVGDNEFATSTDAICNDALRVSHIESNESIPLERLNCPPNLLCN